MISRVLHKLWNASPASLTRAVQNRLLPKRQPEWFTVHGGPLKGAELYLPDARGAWGEMIAGTFDSFIYDELRSIKGI